MSDRPQSRDEELAEVPLFQADPAIWPRGVRTIGINEFDNFGINRQSVLFWNGRIITVEKHFTLTFWQQIWAGIVGLAALMVFISSIAQGFTGYNQWACTVDWYAVCPSPHH